MDTIINDILQADRWFKSLKTMSEAEKFYLIPKSYSFLKPLVKCKIKTIIDEEVWSIDGEAVPMRVHFAHPTPNKLDNYEFWREPLIFWTDNYVLHWDLKGGRVLHETYISSWEHFKKSISRG